MRGRTLAWALAVTALIVVVVILLEGSGDVRSSADPAPTVTVLPLTSATSSAEQDSVLLPMGHPDDPANTFWELFLRAPGGSWTLRTPPGVADNGGLVLSVPLSGPLTAGFLPSAHLTFSPIAQSSSGGRTWSAGQIPTALAEAPDALATGTGGQLLALTSGDRGSVLSRAGGLSSWQPVVDGVTLAHSIRGCAAASVSAVSVDQGRPLLGLSCPLSGQVGVATTSSVPTPGASWQNIGPLLSGGLRGRTTVLRLEQTARGVSGLASIRSTAATSSIVAFWGSGNPLRWQQSGQLAVPEGWSVESTSVGGGGVGQALTVLLESGRRHRVVEVSGPTGLWTDLPKPPPGVGAVAALTGETDAFVCVGSRLTVWAWTPGTVQWRRTRTIAVPLQYGSSS